MKFSFTVEQITHDGSTETMASRVGVLTAHKVVKMLIDEYPEECKEIRIIPRMEADE